MSQEEHCPFKCFKILLPGARHLNNICLNFQSLGESTGLKALVEMVNTHTKQLMHLSLEAKHLERPDRLQALQFHCMDRLKTLTTSAPLILGSTETDDSRRPLYDGYMYKRLPHNLEELYLTFNSALGLVRNVHEPSEKSSTENVCTVTLNNITKSFTRDPEHVRT